MLRIDFRQVRCESIRLRNDKSINYLLKPIFSEFSITGFHPSYSTECEKIFLCLLIKQKKFVFLSFSLLLKDILYWIPVSRLLGLLAFEDISKTVLIFLTVLHMVMSFFTFCDIKKLIKKILLKIKFLFFPRDRMYSIRGIDSLL